VAPVRHRGLRRGQAKEEFGEIEAVTAWRRVLLIRHGVVDFDAPQEFRISPRGRQWDPPLSEEGRRQARALADRLVLMDAPAAIYVSPFRRCVETIEPFAKRVGIDPVLEEDIGEVFIGSWEGLSFEEIVSGDEELARRFREFEAMFSMAPGGESADDLRRRVVPAVEAMVHDNPSGDLVLVTHGGVINSYFGQVLGIEEDMFFLPENASINTVMAEGEARRVRFLNDTRHVTDPRVFVPPPPAMDE
jgi:broad specificity phosphatase PhoE